MKNVLMLLMVLLAVQFSYAQKININNFVVKESLLKNSKLAVIATDSLDHPMEQINGIYTFTVSGFTQSLKFNDGVAIMPLQLERSAFVYMKHKNDTGTHSKLLYVYKKDGNLNPYAISTLWLVLFPLGIILLAFMFRRLIIVAIIVLLIFFYFNHSNGLSVSTFFESIFDMLKRPFNNN
jgi:hypothetical protein